MRLPNKVNRYRTTTIYQMVEIMNVINGNTSLVDLFSRVSNMMGPKEYYEALSALYAVGKIKFLDDGRIAKC